MMVSDSFARLTDSLVSDLLSIRSGKGTLIMSMLDVLLQESTDPSIHL
jgi:hypothetical protein